MTTAFIEPSDLGLKSSWETTHRYTRVPTLDELRDVSGWPPCPVCGRREIFCSCGFPECQHCQTSYNVDSDGDGLASVDDALREIIRLVAEQLGAAHA